MEIELGNAMEVTMLNFGIKLGEHIVRELSNKYNFDVGEALQYLKLDGMIQKEGEKKEGEKKKTTTKKKANIPLPFCGVINEECCCAIRLNHSLYTQCTNLHTEENGSNPVCATCKRQLEKNSDEAPTYGYVNERMEQGATFRVKGKSPVNYGNIMEKLKITRNEAEQEAAKQGLTIPENQFEVKKGQRGRPKKDVTAVDTSGSDDEPPKVETKRGRPKKQKPVVSSITGDDMIKNLVDTVNKETPELEPEAAESDDEEQVEVVPITIKGTKYLKAATGMLYDPVTWDEVGKWNETTNEIENTDSDEA